MSDLMSAECVTYSAGPLKGQVACRRCGYAEIRGDVMDHFREVHPGLIGEYEGGSR